MRTMNSKSEKTNIACGRTICLLMLFDWLGLVAANEQPTPPNIVFILLDNVGQEWFGCYGSEEQCTQY